jgi:hypothetical protein
MTTLVASSNFAPRNLRMPDTIDCSGVKTLVNDFERADARGEASRSSEVRLQTEAPGTHRPGNPHRRKAEAKRELREGNRKIEEDTTDMAMENTSAHLESHGETRYSIADAFKAKPSKSTREPSEKTGRGE